jgi:hypothetical protein
MPEDINLEEYIRAAQIKYMVYMKGLGCWLDNLGIGVEFPVGAEALLHIILIYCNTHPVGTRDYVPRYRVTGA